MYRAGWYNVRVVVGSSYVVVRCVFVTAQRAVDMGRLSLSHIHHTLSPTTYDEPTTTRTLYQPALYILSS